MSQPPPPELIVVGAGIIGAACAEACARAGLQVLVLDRGFIAGETTASAMGHLVVMDDSQPQFDLTRYSVNLWHQHAPHLPASVEYDPCGTIWVAADNEEMQAVQRKHEFYTRHGVAAQILSPADLAHAEPNLRPGLAGGLLVPHDAVLYPPAAARYLLEQAQSHGAVIRTRTTVRSIDADGTLTLVDDSGRFAPRAVVSTLSAPRILIATGCDAPALLPGWPVRRRKGHLVITDRHPGFVRHQLIELGYLKSAHGATTDSVAFNIQPRKTGQMLIGSSRQYDATPGTIEPHILDRMLHRATEYLPSLPSLSAIRIWTGDRPAAPDKLPIIGPIPGNDRLWLASGHEGLGITTSLGTAQLVADLLTGRSPALSAAPYAPSRPALHPTPAA